ncbi:MAG: hypothetical protein H7222_01920 [Methylotenera sp.]|nr:hypothetical protein [Oligoflexia bacterium]
MSSGSKVPSFKTSLALVWFGVSLILMSDPSSTVSSVSYAEEDAGLMGSLKALRKVPSGQVLLARAEKAWKISGDEAILGFLKNDSVSRTDAVLTRHYDPVTGKESRERQVTVYIRKEQSFEDRTLDLAHELTHATAAPSWDPYDPNLTAGKYVWAALEAPGGEIEAVVMECQVGLQLSRILPFQVPRCHRYLGAHSVLDANKVRQDFYRVGRWKSEVTEKLQAEHVLFPLLSSEKPELYSSTGRAPYPLALIREFTELNQIACENARRRVSSQAQSGRSPASTAPTSGASPDPVAALLARRCSI